MTYTKSLSTDFGGILNTSQFFNEINADPGINPTCITVFNINDDVNITFDSALSGPEQITLNALISNYTIIIDPIIQFDSSTGTYGTTTTITSSQTANRIISMPDATDTLVALTEPQTITNKTLISPILTTPQINDISLDHHYIIAVSELTANRTVTLPLLSENDMFVFEAFTQTLTNKTIISPIINQITTNGTEEVLIFADAGNAVNEFTVTNAITATNPQLSATGENINVGIDILTKGNGTVNISASNTSTSGEIRLEDNTGNQYVGITAAATTISYTLTLPNTQSSGNQILENNGSGILNWKTAYQIFYAYDNIGNIDITSGFTSITWDTEIRKDSIYKHSVDSSDITFASNGDYLVSTDISTNKTSDRIRSTTVIRILLDTGSGFLEIEGTRGFAYNRNTTSGENTCTVTRILSGIISGNIIRVEAMRLNGIGTILTIPNGCRIYIEKK